MNETYLKLNPGLSDILLTATTVDNLLRLRNLRPNRLCAKVLDRIALNSIDAQS